jgi:hypothetical protein
MKKMWLGLAQQRHELANGVVEGHGPYAEQLATSPDDREADVLRRSAEQLRKK